MKTWLPSSRHLQATLIGLAMAVAYGCGAFWESPPPPPSAEAMAAMQAAQSEEIRRADAVRQRIEQIRQRRDAGSRPRQPVLPTYEEWTIAETITDSLSRMGEAAVPELIAALQDSRVEVRRRAARMLARIGPEAAAAVPELVNRLDDVDAEVRKSAIRALGQIGPAARDSVRRLLELLDAETSAEQPTESAPAIRD